MPRGDGTGPRGMGAMTGRGAGTCAEAGMPGTANPVPGGGFGMGFGRGSGAQTRGFGGGGRRNMFYATGLPGWARCGGYAAPYGPPAAYQKPDPAMEKQLLAKQAEALQSELEFIKNRLAEVESETAAE